MNSKNKLNVKSIIIGLVLGLCICFAFGMAGSPKYQICINDKDHVAICDTNSGRVWLYHSHFGLLDYGTPQAPNKVEIKRTGLVK